ncbi:MAG TPA: hypothetical protein VKU82_13155 [Planctomycetaceae bacterium]|nr:hypothetical protein [Planctomycetaceae bacterium]
MTIKSTLPFFIFFAWASAPVIGQDSKKDEANGKLAAFEQFKQLAGEWVGKEVKGPNAGIEVRVAYKVTSAGSAVVETLFPGTEHEMVTVIHRDGDDLVLTHYCALGNQPQMKASGKGEDKKIEFKFVRATNLKSEKDMHMHDVAFTFVNKDTLKSEWTHYDDGKSAGTVVFELKRKQ